MQKAHSVTMLGTGLIGMFYTQTLHGQRGRDRVKIRITSYNVCYTKLLRSHSCSKPVRKLDVPRNRPASSKPSSPMFAVCARLSDRAGSPDTNSTNRPFPPSAIHRLSGPAARIVEGYMTSSYNFV